MAARNLTAVIKKEDDLYVADCPTLGTVSQGTSSKEALENLREATTLYLEETGTRNEKTQRHEAAVDRG